MSRRPSPATRAILHAPSRLYSAHAGWLLGHRFLRLTHTGRKSGRTYHTVLEVVGRLPESGEVVVVAGLGPSADWYRNLQAAAAQRVEIGRDRYTPTHRVLNPDEAATVLADYERHNRLAAPVVRAVLSRLIGWHYDSSAQARARLTRELPFVAFRPHPEVGSGGNGHARGETRHDAPPPVAVRRRGRLSLTANDLGGGVHLIELRGELDIDGATTVLAEITPYVVEDSVTVLDIGALEFLDSGGMHALIVLARIARTRDATLRLARPTPPVADLLARTHADAVIDVRTRVADALEG